MRVLFVTDCLSLTLSPFYDTAAGWAPYVSCNAPEAKPRNTPEDPICICMCYADRLIALQPKGTIERHCGPPVWHNGTQEYLQCKCAPDDDSPAGASGGISLEAVADGAASKWVTPNRSKVFVGRSEVWLPYFYYQVPMPQYPSAQSIGHFYSTPRDSACAHDAEVGAPVAGAAEAARSPNADHDPHASRCTWKRLPQATVIYPWQLEARGWDSASPAHFPLAQHGPNTTEQVLRNLAVWQTVWAELNTWLQPRCCGC